MSKRTQHTTPDGRIIIRDTLPDASMGGDVLLELAQAVPAGHHLWRLQLQRSDRGRRCAIEVQYRPEDPSQYHRRR